MANKVRTERFQGDVIGINGKTYYAESAAGRRAKKADERAKKSSKK